MTRSFRTLLAAALAAAVLAAPDAFAQTYPPAGMQPGQPAQPVHRLEISAFTGWQVNGDVDAGSAELVIDDAQSFGASIGVQARPGTRGEFIWTYSRTQAQFDSIQALYNTKPFDVDVHYFQIGGTQTFMRGRVEPFAGATMGAVWYAPENAQTQSGLTTYDLADTWRFAFTLGGGANIFLNQAQTFALHLHARMLVPVFFDSGGFYVGTGGSGLAVSGGIPAVAGDFGVGLTLAR